MRRKNALRKHYIAPYKGEENAESIEFKLLAKYIATANDETDEDTDDTGYYDGDGTPEETVISVSAGYSFEGVYDPEDEAQKIIAGMRYKIGDDRRVWFKVVSSDGKMQHVGVANVSGIKAGDGDATEYEKFECTIRWIKLPKESAVVGG
ncbi:phage tail protein [Aerococcaceae bacterium zg-ZJ1578]|uniref:phage tail tube protein n=1 Tax=Aerococcaceae TaxID=186827 RepID=UPI0013BB5917|nr:MULTISPECIES: phage tail protein [unclassified Facklamia]MBK0348231.1 phage tail protein [Aerococcaceae bacterium zg-1578]NEW64253.1 phage tail protein [Facklamia sp. 252]NEW68768.1 phage tail protein [Facklamia sp. 253]QQD64720.1 phage tail protein [Aerococcaceae bacterium zg-252]